MTEKLTMEGGWANRVVNWLRDRTINLLLNLLCLVLPGDQRFELVIEPVDNGASMLATLRKPEERKTDD